MWDVEYTDELLRGGTSLTEAEQVDVAACVGLLEEQGVHLRHPYSSEELYEQHIETLKKEGLIDE